MSTWTRPCNGGNERSMFISVSDRDLTVYRRSYRHRETVGWLRSNDAVELALEILRRLAPTYLIGE